MSNFKEVNKKLLEQLSAKIRDKFVKMQDSLKNDNKAEITEQIATTEKELVALVKERTKQVMTPAAIALETKAACSDILCQLLKQNNALREDLQEVKENLSRLSTADKLYMTDKEPTTSSRANPRATKVTENLDPQTFWTNVFIEGQIDEPNTFQNLAKIDHQLVRLWQCIQTTFPENPIEFEAGRLLNAFQDYANLSPAPETFNIALHKFFSLMRLWNFPGQSFKPEFQKKIKNLHYTKLHENFQSRKQTRLPHHPKFLEFLFQIEFGSNWVKSFRDFQPKTLSKTKTLHAALVLTFILANRAPELENVVLDFENSCFLTEKSYSIGQDTGRVILMRLKILKHKTSNYGHSKFWTIIVGLIPSNQALKKRKTKLTKAGQALLYLHHYKTSKNSLLNNTVKNLNLTKRLTYEVRKIYAELGLGCKNRSFYSGKNSMVTLALLLKISRERISHFVGWKSNQITTYTTDPFFSLQCRISELDQTLKDTIKLSVKLANKSTLFKAFNWN